MPQISRRRFIYGSLSTVGLGTALSLVNSCSANNSDTSQDLAKNIQFVQRFPQVLVPGEVRLPISLALNSGLIDTSSDFKFPQALTAKLVDLSSDKIISENLVAPLHGAEFSVPYYPFRVKIDKPGNYSLLITGGPDDGTAFSVVEPDQVLVPKVGEMLPGFDTPTFDDHRQVEPICTHQPEQCPFHDVTLNDALKLKVPIGFLIGTPSHCSTGTCAPALESLIEISNTVGAKASFVHSEVYADEAATVIAPAVKEFNMTFEPSLFIADATGKIVERLDAVFDAKEISDALTRAGVK